MEVDPQPEDHSLTHENSSITCSNESRDATRRTLSMEPNTPAGETRSNSIPTSATGCNTEETSETTRCNDGTTGSKDIPTTEGSINDMKEESNNTDVTVTNPFQVNEDEDDSETLEDLGPELAKMGRILTRKITKSLSKA